MDDWQCEKGNIEGTRKGGLGMRDGGYWKCENGNRLKVGRRRDLVILGMYCHLEVRKLQHHGQQICSVNHMKEYYTT